MDALKKNGFWVIVGLIVAIAAGLFGYRFLAVQGDIDRATASARGNKDQIEQQILNQRNKAPNSSWVPVLEQQQKNAIAERQACYREYGVTNELLSKWADEKGEPVDSGAAPPGGVDAWKARYTNIGKARLTKELQDKNIQVGIEAARTGGASPFGNQPKPAAEEGGLAFVEPAEMKGDVKVYQKQWWIQERFVEAVLKSSNIVRVEKVEFPAAEAAAPAADVPQPGAAPPTADDSYVKPNQIKVSFQLQVMYGDIPKLVANLIEFGKDGKVDANEKYPIRFTNVDLRVTKLSSFDGKATDTEEIKEDAPKEGFDPNTWKPTKDESPKPVRVVVRADVLDFNIPKEVYSKQP